MRLRAAVVLASLALVGCSSAPAARRDDAAPVTPPVTPTAPSGSMPFGTVAAPGVGATTVPAAEGTGAPIRLTIPAIGVDTRQAGIERLPLESDGSLAAPRGWQRVGWYAGGTVPGDVGPAIVAGHVDSRSGPAVFYRLTALRPGDLVHVTRADGTRLTFVVDGARRYPKARFPTSTVYGATPDPQLRLITCTGSFDADARSYRDNLVVTAHLRNG